MKFDVVIGNPPYQNSGKTKGNKIWPKFIMFGSEIVKKDGILSMITPSSWTSGGQNIVEGKYGVLKDLFSKRQILFASFNNITKRFFKVGIDISYFIMENKDIYQNSTFELQDDKIIKMNLKDKEIISPKMTYLDVSLVDKLINKPKEKFDMISFDYSGHIDMDRSDIKTDEYPHEFWIMGSDKTNNLMIKYQKNEIKPHFKRKKLLISMNVDNYHPYYSNENQMTTRQGFVLFLNDNENKENVYSVFYSKPFKYLIQYLRTSGFIKTNIAKNLPKIDLTKNWTDQELYEHFSLTEEEIKYVEENVK